MIAAEPDHQPRGHSNRVASRQIDAYHRVVIATEATVVQRAAEAMDECMPEARWRFSYCTEETSRERL